mgnify:FL=1
MNDDDLQETLQEILNQEIARELLSEKNLSEDEFDKIWKLCKGNPYNAPALHAILELNNE